MRLHKHRFGQVAFCCAFALGPFAGMAAAQAITIDSRGNPINGSGAPVDRRFAQIQPTKVDLPQPELNAKTRLELIRVLQSEQGFAMRPFPRGHKGLTLVANGKLSPAGEDYLKMVTDEGLCAKPGDRVVLTDVKFDHSKIIFDLNDGPDLKHRFLRHVQLGAGNVSPVVTGNEQDPTGARLTLEFKGRVPDLTGAQVKALLAPLISFDVKTPVQAFTDTLPPKLKDAILSHHVMVGMTTDMVIFAKGSPDRKVREVQENMPFEEWIYGAPPKDVEFVRINGNRVIQVEIAKIGESPQIFTKNEVEGMMRTDGTPLVAADTHGTRTIQLGDVDKNPDTQAAAPPPSLRNPGEAPPQQQGADRPGVMKPVQFPKPKPDDEGNDTSASQSTPAPAATQPAGQTQPAAGQPGSATTPPADASQPGTSKPAPDGASQPPSQPHLLSTT
jgi:hypothetical protein